MADVSVIDFGDGGGNRNIKDVSAARSSAIAPIEDGSTSSAAYSVGDYICRNGQLYKVITAIAIGDIIGNNIQLTKVVDEIGSGGGLTVSITPAYQSGTKLADYSINGTQGVIYAPEGSSSKHRYTITATNWSNSVDANGYYTYDVTLQDQSFVVPTPVNVYLSGADDNTFATDTETTQYGYLKGVKLLTSTSVRLYAKTKPTSMFYIYISSDGGTGGSGGINYSTTEQDTGLTWIDGKKIYQKTYSVSMTNNNPMTQTGYLENSYWDGLTTSDIVETIVSMEANYLVNYNGSGNIYTKTPQPHVVDVIAQRQRTNNNYLRFDVYHWDSGYGYSGSTVYITVRYTKAS